MVILIDSVDHAKSLSYSLSKKDKNKPSWDETAFRLIKSNVSNYDPGNYGEKMAEIVLNRGGIPSSINKIDDNDILSLWEQKQIQVEVKTSSLNPKGVVWFNQIRDMKDWDWIMFVVLDPSNKVRCYLCKDKTKLYSSGLLRNNNGNLSSLQVKESVLLGFCELYASGEVS